MEISDNRPSVPWLVGASVAMMVCIVLFCVAVVALFAALFEFSLAQAVRVGGSLGAVVAGTWMAHRLQTYLNQGVRREPQTIQVLGPRPEEIRIIPYRGDKRLIDGVPESDLIWFCEQVGTIGHSQRSWLKKTAPSGMIVDAEYWGKLSAPLRKVGIIKDVRPRSAGTLVERNPDRILATLGIRRGPQLHPTD